MTHLPPPHLPVPPCTPPSMGRRGFSLVEIMVVIAILSLLLVLTLRVRGMWKETAQKQLCSTAMASLRNAAKSYEQVLPVPLHHADASGYYVDLAGNGTKNRALTPMEYFLFRISGHPLSQGHADRVPSSMLVTVQAAPVQIWQGNSPSAALMKTGYILKTVKDPWGMELKYRAVSAAATETDPAIPASPSSCFASAGPDGRWGALTNHDINLPDDDAHDNVYMNQ